jgi:hypothetical protein
MPNIRLAIRRPEDIPDDVFVHAMQDFYDLLVELTPVDTGFCSESWELDLDTDLAIFFNAADYSSYLDEGWSSQAPNGITDPALEQLPDILDDWLLKYYK